MLPEVLKGGQRVMMTADPTGCGFVRLGWQRRRQRLDVVFPVMPRDPLARMERFRDNWICGTFRSSRRRAGIRRLEMDKDVRSDCCRWPKIPVVPWITVHRADWEKSTEGDSAQHRAEVQVSGVREAGDTGIFGGNDESASREELASGVEPGVRICDENFGREGDGWHGRSR